jgi:hypothetical protein
VFDASGSGGFLLLLADTLNAAFGAAEADPSLFKLNRQASVGDNVSRPGLSTSGFGGGAATVEEHACQRPAAKSHTRQTSTTVLSPADSAGSSAHPLHTPTLPSRARGEGQSPALPCVVSQRAAVAAMHIIRDLHEIGSREETMARLASLMPPQANPFTAAAEEESCESAMDRRDGGSVLGVPANCRGRSDDEGPAAVAAATAPLRRFLDSTADLRSGLAGALQEVGALHRLAGMYRWAGGRQGCSGREGQAYVVWAGREEEQCQLVCFRDALSG